MSGDLAVVDEDHVWEVQEETHSIRQRTESKIAGKTESEFETESGRILQEFEQLQNLTSMPDLLHCRKSVKPTSPKCRWTRWR